MWQDLQPECGISLMGLLFSLSWSVFGTSCTHIFVWRKEKIVLEVVLPWKMITFSSQATCRWMSCCKHRQTVHSMVLEQWKIAVVWVWGLETVGFVRVRGGKDGGGELIWASWLLLPWAQFSMSWGRCRATICCQSMARTSSCSLLQGFHCAPTVTWCANTWSWRAWCHQGHHTGLLQDKPQE